MYKTIAATILGLLLTNSIFVYLDIEVRNAYGSTNTIRRYLELQNPFYSEEDLENNVASWKKWIRELKLAGVNIVAGSDAYVDLETPRGESAKQTIWCYADAWLSPEDVLQSATINAATALDRRDQIGVIKENAFADIVVFEDNMKTDIKKLLFEVKMVMKNGEIEVIK